MARIKDLNLLWKRCVSITKGVSPNTFAKIAELGRGDLHRFTAP
jgi:hypothetical protein